jgi:hypothetical protein
MEIKKTSKTKKRSEVAIAIWRAGYGFKDFAAQYGCDVSFVTLVVNGYRRSVKLEKLVAETLKQPVEALFPGHGWPRGKRRTGRAA